MSDLRERVARALAAAHGYEPDALTYREADAAIALVLEEAAKVAAAESVRPGYTTNEHMMAHRIAAAIRALKEKSDD